MGSIKCDKVSCKYHIIITGFGPGWGVCRRGQGYNYGGGDIHINKFGHCISSEKIAKPKPR